MNSVNFCFRGSQCRSDQQKAACSMRTKFEEFIFTALLMCWTPASSMTISLPSASQTHVTWSEEEKEERNSNLSTQHFLPGIPQTQAFPRPKSLDRKRSWILAEGQLWCPRKHESRVRTGVGTRAVRELQIDGWFLGSQMTDGWLVSWYELSEREHEWDKEAWSMLWQRQRTARED